MSLPPVEQSLNPYASPAESGEPDARGIAIKALRGPSLALLITGVAWGGGAVVFTLVAAILVSVILLTRSDVQVSDLIDLRDSLQLIAALPSCFIAYGAWCMRRGVRYRVSMTAAILACIPMISPMIWIGIPFGIWALIVLRRKDVRAAFAAARVPSTEYPVRGS
jgi:hypothetical protein